MKIEIVDIPERTRVDWDRIAEALRALGPGKAMKVLISDLSGAKQKMAAQVRVLARLKAHGCPVRTKTEGDYIYISRRED